LWHPAAVFERSFVAILTHQGAALLVASTGDAMVGYEQVAAFYEKPLWPLSAAGPRKYGCLIALDVSGW